MAKNKNTMGGAVKVADENRPKFDMALFQAPPDAGAKLERRGLPPLVKPDSVPIGGYVTGVIVKIIGSMGRAAEKGKEKGKLFWLRHETGQEFLFPCTGTIRQAIAPGVESEDLQAVLEAEIGKQLICRRGENRMSDKYKKAMFVFEVFTGPAPAKK